MRPIQLDRVDARPATAKKAANCSGPSCLGLPSTGPNDCSTAMLTSRCSADWWLKFEASNVQGLLLIEADPEEVDPIIAPDPYVGRLTVK